MKVLTPQKEKEPKIAHGVETVRMRFAKARKFLNPVNYIIQMGYAVSNGKKRKTPIGRAMRRLLQEAVVGSYPNIDVDPELAKLSVGIQGVPNVTGLAREEARISLSWDSVLTRSFIDQLDDRIILCAYAIEQELAAINDHQVLRQHGALEMVLPEGMEDLPVHLYLIVHDRDRINFSDSRYLGVY